MTPPVDELRSAVVDFFGESSAEFGLDPARLDVTYVLNWGGFVNHSFRVGDGRTELHVKLAVTEETRSGLERWYDLHRALREYHAPPVLARFEAGGATGLVFPALTGSTPPCTPEVVGTTLGVLRRLWADEELASHLPGPPRTAADVYFDSYHDRFTEDLRHIASETPPFLTRTHLELMEGEVAKLAETVESHPAFQEELSSPVHGDLWLGNVLWNDPSSWHLLDWDDLQIGDPAMDLATLTGPTAHDPRPLKGVGMPGIEEPRLEQRLEVLGRASLLDWVIDPLADWIEARAVPEVEARVREEKHRVHARAMELYRTLYGRN
jgi:hypothetical protein